MLFVYGFVVVSVSTRRAVAYIRVSQEDENPDNQKRAIIEWAKKNNVDVIGFFVDVDVSGGVPPRERPKYKTMI